MAIPGATAVAEELPWVTKAEEAHLGAGQVRVAAAPRAVPVRVGEAMPNSEGRYVFQSRKGEHVVPYACLRALYTHQGAAPMKMAHSPNAPWTGD